MIVEVAKGSCGIFRFAEIYCKAKELISSLQRILVKHGAIAIIRGICWTSLGSVGAGLLSCLNPQFARAQRNWGMCLQQACFAARFAA